MTLRPRPCPPPQEPARKSLPRPPSPPPPPRDDDRQPDAPKDFFRLAVLGLAWSLGITICFVFIVSRIGPVNRARRLVRVCHTRVPSSHLADRCCVVAQIAVGSSITLDLVRPDCSWVKQFTDYNPVLCFYWNVTHHGAFAATGASRAGCSNLVCGKLFEASRGKDNFINFDEAVAFDDSARKRATASGSACAWPSQLMRGDACWQHCSDAGQKELVASDACALL